MSTTRRCWVGKSLFRALHTCTGGVRSAHLIANLYRQRHLTHQVFASIQHISRTTTSFNERDGSSSSEGGENFDFLVFVYLPTFFFALRGGLLIPSGGSST